MCWMRTFGPGKQLKPRKQTGANGEAADEIFVVFVHSWKCGERGEGRGGGCLARLLETTCADSV